jgi:hypothetical protein
MERSEVGSIQDLKVGSLVNPRRRFIAAVGTQCGGRDRYASIWMAMEG